MTRNEFLEKLRNALENDLGGSAVQDNVEYYGSYIMEEVRKGRPEAEVVEELGDPWVIARSLIDAAENVAETYSGYQAKEASGGQGSGQSYGTGGSVHVFGIDSWWKKLLLVLGIIGVVLIVIAVIGGIFSLLMPLIVPIIVVMLVVRLVGRRR
ncbi:DUF1700 domain-containing protein [Dorea sp. D27]|uniref:DUF1700 domain-containing protein n=1 Tax=Dorea sp. D27 TaxID=658665 RepID=UPI000673232D|nr:DUF1700 domain-containing protein [Dorea sp. D27]KMZ53964.1 hypothetical protein HMPREF0980_02007 [Dorea sp. D27]